jgi:adenylate cyclase
MTSSSRHGPRSTITGEMDDEAARTEEWRSMLTGENDTLKRLRRYWKLLPSSPRCKVCAAPFRGPGKLATSIIMHGQSKLNPMLCGMCFGKLRQEPGGAEVEVSVLFADVRGSTGLAEKTTSAEFRALLQRFYSIAGSAIERNGGVVDKFLGDGIMALFIPVVAGERHAARAITAGQELLEETERSELAAKGVRVGVGVQTGTAFVGVLGIDEKLDFTALGDTVNVAARLGSVAGPGELLVSRTAWEAAALPLDEAARREIEISGREGLLEVVVDRPGMAVASTAA